MIEKWITYPAMFPMQAPTQIIAETSIFFDCPPTFDVMRDSDRTSKCQLSYDSHKGMLTEG
jgi:hypothetical protein